MIPELGHFALWLAFGASLLLGVLDRKSVV